MSDRIRRLAAALCLALAAMSARAQEQQPASSEDDVAVLIAVSVEELEQQAPSWDVERLTAEAEGYRASMEAATARKESAQEALAAAAEGDKPAAEAEVSRHGDAIDSLAGRLQVIVNALADKGGDVGAYQVLLTRVTGVRLDNVSTDLAVSLVGEWVEKGRAWLVDRGPELIFQAAVFLLILLVFKLLSSILGRVAERALGSARLRLSSLLKDFAVGLVRKLTLLVGLMIAVSSVGVDIAPLLAGVGVVGFIVGFALQETLSNFAAGVMILIYRPYDVGDLVTAAGVMGKVERMSLVNTTLVTLDNQEVILPNRSIWGGQIINVTSKPTRRVDLVVGISYTDDMDKAIEVLGDVLRAHPKVLADPEPIVKVTALGESSVDLIVRPWCKTGDYWDVHWDITKACKEKLDAVGISIPFPQRDLHVIQGQLPAA